MVVFIDGEIAGHDPDCFAAEPQGRRQAAEFVVKQVHRAQFARWVVQGVEQRHIP